MGIAKRYPVFDCDAHVTESPEMWGYLSEGEKERVRGSYWPEDGGVRVNGEIVAPATWGRGRAGFTQGFHGRERRIPSVIEVAGPGTNKKLLRKLYSMELTDEQLDYVEQRGARDPHARLADMDLQGIDQVMVIPLMMFGHYLAVRDGEAAALVARGYNDWVHDWCGADRERLFAAAVLPLQDPALAARELRRVAGRGFRVAMVRPIEIQGRYPTHPDFEPLWRAFEETGLVVAMHPNAVNDQPINHPRHGLHPPGTGLFLNRAIDRRQIAVPSQTLGFAHESMTWLTCVLLSGFLERYPGIRHMAIMESNASWLPSLLEELDRAVRLYRSERRIRLQRSPSECFRERCLIAFEGDESPVFRQSELYREIGIWSSDVYHHDGADAWSAIREMREHGVSEAAEEELMGGNARRMYAIEPPRRCVESELPLPARPAWYPRLEDVEREYGPLQEVR
jgi:predicted TIM-barrel fold metal-dependent hydrolase